MASTSTDWSPLAGGTLFERAGRAIALMGVALPLLFIGHSKFAVFEVEALRQIIAQALLENVPVVTPDASFKLYEGLKIVW